MFSFLPYYFRDKKANTSQFYMNNRLRQCIYCFQPCELSCDPKNPSTWKPYLWFMRQRHHQKSELGRNPFDEMTNGLLQKFQSAWPASQYVQLTLLLPMQGINNSSTSGSSVVDLSKRKPADNHLTLIKAPLLHQYSTFIVSGLRYKTLSSYWNFTLN